MVPASLSLHLQTAPYKVFATSSNGGESTYTSPEASTYLDRYSFCNTSQIVVLDQPVAMPIVPTVDTSSIPGLTVRC